MAQQRIGRSPGRGVQQSLSAYWRGQSEAWLRSGLTQAAFCEEQGLSLSAFRWWRWKLKKDSALAVEPVVAEDKGQGMRLVPVRVVDPERAVPCSGATDSSRAFEVILGGGIRIRVPSDFDAEALTRLVRTLEAVGC